MEDSHISHIELVPDVHCFGVFDGHGGKQITQARKWPCGSKKHLVMNSRTCKNSKKASTKMLSKSAF
jgi:serine/threonine protein phosphatase PrpC